MAFLPGGPQTFFQPDHGLYRDFGTDRQSSGSWETQYSADELKPDVFLAPGVEPGFPKPGFSERGSPLSHFQALERAHTDQGGQRGLSMASLSLEDAGPAFAQDDRFQQHGEQQSVGWGGRPLQQQRFKQRAEEGGYGYHQMQRSRAGNPRGKQPAPNQRPMRGGHDGRMKNQGYRRLWQQVTQVGGRPGWWGAEASWRHHACAGPGHQVLGSLLLGLGNALYQRWPAKAGPARWPGRVGGPQAEESSPARRLGGPKLTPPLVRAGWAGAEAGGERQHPLLGDDGGGPAGDCAAAAT
jgi:hypothetical protein